MNTLLKIEYQKIKFYRTFWIFLGLYLLILLLVFLSVQLFLDWLAEKGEQIENIDPSKIPLLQFPDIWHNITWIAGLFKIVPAIFVIISITNEITFNTLRQNIIDGLSRRDFLISKIWLIVILSAVSTVFLFLIGLIFGLIYTPSPEFNDILLYSFFLIAHFFEVFLYLIFTFFLGLLIKRTGLTMGLLLLYTYVIEPIITFRIKTDWITGLFPVKAINNLIRFPFKKYALREIQDYVAWQDAGIALFYIILLISLIYLVLKKRDL
ncbi:MAG: ABC transporter permease [Bacteroidales bacterium]|nr:ABC transporter permease [Bacteroidales bacterium]